MAAVREFWERLGLPGLVDSHVHFPPPNIQRAVYAQFDAGGPKIGREWPIRYRQSHAERIEIPGAMACAASRRRPMPTSPASRPTPTTGPPGSRGRCRVALVGDLLPRGACGVVRRRPGRRRRRGLQGAPAGGGSTSTTRCSTGCGARSGTPARRSWSTPGPGRSATTSPGRARRSGCCALPRLTRCSSHTGAPRCAEFLDLAERFERVHLDTTMVFTDFFPRYPSRAGAAAA